MKIAYLMNAPIPSKRANAVHVMKMCQAFKKNGIDITLFCEKTQDNLNLTDEEIFINYNIIHKFPIVRISGTYLFGNKINILLKYWKMIKCVKENQFDVIYGRSLVGVFFLRKTYNFFYESHVSPINFLFKNLEKLLLKQEKCLKFIVISSELKKYYLHIFPWVDSNEIMVLHDGADEVEQNNIEIFSFNNSKSVSEDVVIGYLGHLYPGKCMEVLLDIAQSKKELYFHVVGGTQEWIEYWNSKLKIKKIKNVQLYGYVPNCDIGKYYNSFDICILPFSQNVYYSGKKNTNIGRWISPLKLFEAMSFKKAILVSNLPTIREVLDDEKTALFADPDNIKEWGEKLDRLIKNKKLRDQLGKNANMVFCQKYTWEKRVQNILKIIELKMKQNKNENI